MTAVDELRKMGEALGGLAYVQGPGGNVSIKQGGDLFVKASGKRLRDVALEGGYAKVPLDSARKALDGDPVADKEVFAIRPRPSLEAYFHVLGGNAVAHTHAFGALLHLCASDTLDDDLGGSLRSIPYVRPGRNVAVAVRDILGDKEQAAVGLRSHGLIAYGGSAADVIASTQEISRKSRTKYGDVEPIESRVAEYSKAETFAVPAGCARALPRRKIFSDRPRYLFPDAVICASVVRVSKVGDLHQRAAETLERFQRASLVVSDDGDRLICALNPSQLEQSIEVLASHDVLEEILAPRGIAAYLNEDEPAALLGMPSEVYRIQLAGEKVK